MDGQPGNPYAASLAFLLSQVGARSAELFAERLAPLGISPRAFGVLSNLSSDGEQTQQQLADSLGLHRNNMVGLVDEMEAAGWVRRHRDDRDRRAFQIRLTSRGRRLVLRVLQSITAMDDVLAGDLDAEERATMLRLLQRVAAALDLTPGVHPHLRARPR